MLSRRELFGSGWGEALRDALRGAAPPPPRSASPAYAFLRPPGALDEPGFLAACTRCDACLVACPREAVRRAGHELGDLHEGTPVILPEAQPCWLCKDLPCIAACEPGALQPLEAPRDARMGLVRIREEACFSAAGNPCEVCAERCPVRPKAVRVPFASAPELDAALCTGCAVCAWLCPAQAIEVLPSAVAPGA